MAALGWGWRRCGGGCAQFRVERVSFLPSGGAVGGLPALHTAPTTSLSSAPPTARRVGNPSVVAVSLAAVPLATGALARIRDMGRSGGAGVLSSKLDMGASPSSSRSHPARSTSIPAGPGRVAPKPAPCILVTHDAWRRQRLAAAPCHLLRRVGRASATSHQGLSRRGAAAQNLGALGRPSRCPPLANSRRVRETSRHRRGLA